MIDVRPSTQDDMDYLRENPLEEALKNYPTFPAVDGNTYTAIYKDEILGMGGIVSRWSGVGEGWVILSKNCLNRPVEMFLCIKRVWETILENEAFIRVQAVVRVDFPQAIKMAEKLGMKLEGRLEKYTPDGCDVYMYAKIRS